MTWIEKGRLWVVSLLEKVSKFLFSLAYTYAYFAANKLWGRANPYRSRHGRRICAEMAIATAERIFTFQYDQGAGVAPYLSPEQQIANRGLTRSALIQGPPYEPGYDLPRNVGLSGYGGGRRSRRGSWSHYDQPSMGVPPVSAIPIGGRGIGAYQNAQGYNISDGPMGLPYPQDIQRSPRIIPTAMVPDPYDDPYVPTGAPGSYGGGGGVYPTGAPGSYGGGGAFPIGAPGSYGAGIPQPGGYGAGIPHPGGYGAGISQPGGYGAGIPQPGGYGAGAPYGYEAPMLGPPPYRRQRSYSQGYRQGY